MVCLAFGPSLRQFSYTLWWLLVPFLLMLKRRAVRRPVLDLSDPLFITSLLLKLVLSVALTQGSVPVALREGAKYPYVPLHVSPTRGSS